jgi:adenylyl-sulfate kinase
MRDEPKDSTLVERAIGPLGGVTVWLTGRPASGKTTVAVSLEAALRRLDCDARRLDGDELRQTVCRDLGFSREDRAENVRRAGRYALELAQGGRVAIVSLVSPYAADRQRVREQHREAGLRFVEVHVDCPLAVAEARDPKGLYRRARAGELHGLTGVDDPYEAPSAAEIVLDTSRLTVEDETLSLLVYLGALGAGGR